MTDYPAAMALLIKALKDQHVRLNKSGFGDENTVCDDHYIMILRGGAREVRDRIFHGFISSTPGKIGGENWTR